MHITRIKKVEKKVRSDIRLYKASPEFFFFFLETMLNNGKMVRKRRGKVREDTPKQQDKKTQK